MAAGLPLRVTMISSSRSSTPVTSSGRRALTSEIGRILAIALLDQNSGQPQSSGGPGEEHADDEQDPRTAAGRSEAVSALLHVEAFGLPGTPHVVGGSGNAVLRHLQLCVVVSAC